MKNIIVMATMFLLGCTVYQIYPENYKPGGLYNGPVTKVELGKKELSTDPVTQTGPRFTTVEQVIAKSKGEDLTQQKEKGPLYCRADEVSLWDNTLCVRVCPVGTNLVDGECVGKRFYGFFPHVLEKCKTHDEDYRLLKIDELVKLLGGCENGKLDPKRTNYCGIFPESEAEKVLLIDNDGISIWIGEMKVCDDAYGVMAKNCSWRASINTKTYTRTQFDFFRASPQYGGAVNSGICVRD